MQLISFGFYSMNDFKRFERIINKYYDIILENNYNNIEKETGECFQKLKKLFKLSVVTTLIKNNVSDDGYHSFDLIQEISNFYISKEFDSNEVEEPVFFKILNDIINSRIDKFLLIFSEEFDVDRSIRLKEIKLNELIKSLYNIYVWQEKYFDMNQNTYFGDTYHPLVLDVKRN